MYVIVQWKLVRLYISKRCHGNTFQAVDGDGRDARHEPDEGRRLLRVA